MKLSLLIASILCTSAAMANPVDFSQAVSKAKKVLKKEVIATESLTSEARARVGVASPAPAFYVFNAEDGNGFVIVSGDDEMPEVVAYSHTGAFNAANMHPALVNMLDYYTEVVNDVRNGDVSVSQAQSRRIDLAPAVEPLCKAQWGQDKPYNTLCPQKSGDDCPVGCVATALAQIMYHFAWPEVGTGSARYASGISGVGVISSNFYEHHYAWDAMRATKKENLASAEAAEAVAQLSYDCGIATRMTYDPDGSGTNDDLAMKALYENFGYKASTLRIERRDCYATQEEWNNLVKSELNASRPVLYAGFSTRGGGHEFIIDGYDESDFFHVNWGWDGSSNGYYSIVTLAPSRTSYSFSNDQSIVCGIEPDETGEDKTPHQFRIYMEGLPSVEKDSIALGNPFSFTMNLFYNYSRTAHTWTRAVALYSLDGEQLSLVSPSNDRNYTAQILSYRGYNYASTSVTIPQDTPDGYYSLRCVFCQEEYDEFILPDMVGGSELNNIYIQVKDGMVYLNAEIPSAIAAVDADAQIVARDYFDLSGRKLQNVTKGIVIERQTLSNGKQIVKKVLY